MTSRLRERRSICLSRRRRYLDIARHFYFQVLGLCGVLPNPAEHPRIGVVWALGVRGRNFGNGGARARVRLQPNLRCHGRGVRYGRGGEEPFERAVMVCGGSSAVDVVLTHFIAH